MIYCGAFWIKQICPGPKNLKLKNSEFLNLFSIYYIANHYFDIDNKISSCLYNIVFLFINLNIFFSL